MLTPAVGHMGCLVQPWLPAHLPQPSSCLQPVLLISHLPGTSPQRAEAALGIVCHSVTVSATASSFQPSPCAVKLASVFPQVLSVMGYHFQTDFWERSQK